MPAEIRPCAITPSRMGCTTRTLAEGSEHISLRADGNPAAALRRAIDRPKAENAKALSRDQVFELLKAFHSFGGHRAAVIACSILLAVVPTAEFRGAAWAELTFPKQIGASPGGG